jgi:hypothetical protein
MVTWRVSYSGTINDEWKLKRSGKVQNTYNKKSTATNEVRSRAMKGDRMVVERRDGSVQKDVEITAGPEARRDMNDGTWSPFNQYD